MPHSRFALIFAMVFLAAMLTVGGGAYLSGSTGLPEMNRTLLAPIFVLLWLGLRLRERWRK